jgi:prolyl-tRNA synthetase
MIGGLIMVHGDDSGLVVPPALAATQVVVMAIKPEVIDAVHAIGADLRAAGVRVVVDDRTDTAFGRRAVDWELKGVPVRIEVGPRDLADGTAVVARRIAGGKTSTPTGSLVATVRSALAEDQGALLAQARQRRDARITPVGSLADAREAAADGWAKIPWELVKGAGEAELAASAITVRCLQRADGGVPNSEDEADTLAFVARSY